MSDVYMIATSIAKDTLAVPQQLFFLRDLLGQHMSTKASSHRGFQVEFFELL